MGISITPTQLRVGLGIAGAAAGIGTGLYFNAKSREHVREVREGAQREWSEWRSALDAEFPTRELPTDAEERRFAAFLERHPAPKFLNVKFDDLRRISIDSWEVDSPIDLFRKDGPAVLAGLSALGGTALLQSGAMQGRLGRLGPAASIAGSALLAFGGVTLGTVIASKFIPPAGPDVQEQISRTEWHVPTHWSE